MKKMFPVFSRIPPKTRQQEASPKTKYIPEEMFFFDEDPSITGDPDLDREYIRQLAKAFVEHNPGPGVTYLTLGPKPKIKKKKT